MDLIVIVPLAICLAVSLAIAIWQPVMRSRALRIAGILSLLVLTFVVTDGKGFQAAAQPWAVLGFVLIIMCALAFFVRDLRAGVPWREAISTNRGVLAGAAMIIALVPVSCFPHDSLFVILWPVAILTLLVAGWTWCNSYRRSKSG